MKKHVYDFRLRLNIVPEYFCLSFFLPLHIPLREFAISTVSTLQYGQQSALVEIAMPHFRQLIITFNFCYFCFSHRHLTLGSTFTPLSSYSLETLARHLPLSDISCQSCWLSIFLFLCIW